MGKRYGIVVKQDDGTEVVSNIMDKEGGPPYPGSDNAEVIEDLDPRVKIGMIRGGKGEAAAGFGWNTDVATPPPAQSADVAKDEAERKKAESRARLEEAKGDDDFDARQAAAEAASKKAEKPAAKSGKQS